MSVWLHEPLLSLIMYSGIEVINGAGGSAVVERLDFGAKGKGPDLKSRPGGPGIDVRGS